MNTNRLLIVGLLGALVSACAPPQPPIVVENVREIAVLMTVEVEVTRIVVVTATPATTTTLSPTPTRTTTRTRVTTATDDAEPPAPTPTSTLLPPTSTAVPPTPIPPTPEPTNDPNYCIHGCYLGRHNPDGSCHNDTSDWEACRNNGGCYDDL
jgi:hypothetical protein